MSFTKFARLEDAEVLDIRSSNERVHTASLDKFSEFNEYRTEDGYLYARIRAISSRVNKNHDGWPSVELAGGQDIFDRFSKSSNDVGQRIADLERYFESRGKEIPSSPNQGIDHYRYVADLERAIESAGGTIPVSTRTAAFTIEAERNAEFGYSTFLGKPIFVDHHNSDPERARGVIVDTKLHVEDHRTAAGLDPYYAGAPDNHMPPTWVELLLEVDANSFPKLAKAIIDGKNDSKAGIDGFSMGCFVSGTPITLADGTRKPIEEISLDDEVLTHTGKTEPVTYIMKRKHEGVVYQVHTYGEAQAMILTEEHPVWTKGGWTEARDLQEGDFVLTPKYAGQGHPGIYSFARLLGYYLAEGNLMYDRNRFSDGRPVSVEWNFSADEIELIEEVKTHLDSLGYRAAGPYVKNNCAAIRCNSPELAQRFLDYGNQHSWAKRLHPEVLGWLEDNQRALLSAYFNGDGHFRHEDRVEVGTASERLAHQLQLIATRVGYRMTPPVKQHSPSAAEKRPKYSMQATLVEPSTRTITQAHLDGEGLWRKITKIHLKEYEGYVYNFDVEGDDSYVAADVAVHNCDVEKSVCALCKNAAYSPDEYCEHVRLKGAHFDWVNPKTGRKESKKSYEDCYGIKFFEISAVFDPADETALIRDVVHKEGSVKEADLFSGKSCPHCHSTNLVPLTEDTSSGLGLGQIQCADCGATGFGDELGNPSPDNPPEYQAPGQRIPGPAEQDYETLKLRNQMNHEIPTVDPHHPHFNAAEHKAYEMLRIAGKPIPADLQRYAAYNDEHPEAQCPNCGQIGTAWEGPNKLIICGSCGYDWPLGQQPGPLNVMPHQPGHPDYRGPAWQSSVRTAENPVPQSDLLHAPEEIDTLREETICAVCGSSMDETTCDICGYIEPPDGFENPDLTKAKPEEDPGFEAAPGPTPALEGETTLAQPDLLQGRNPAPTASITSEMAKWEARVNPRLAGRINVIEKPITTSQDGQTDEPKEQIVNDETQPVTSSVRTAKEFIEAAERGKEKQMSKDRVAAEPVPAAKPDARVDVEGVGGVEDASNEQASSADGQVDVEGQGGTGVEGVSADQEGVNVDQGDEHSKNIEGTKTDTWSGTDGQTSPVGGDSFPSDNGQGAGRWSTTVHAYDSDAFPKDDQGLGGGSAAQGTQPADPAGKADDRIDVLKPVTSPENNSGPTDTWSGTDGNGVTRQQDPVTNETLEGSDLVNLQPRSSKHIFTAIKLADLEVELGLLDAEEKYDRMAELENKSPEVVEAELAYASKVKTAGLSRHSRTAHTTARLPSFRASTPTETTSEVTDESLFL